MPIVEGAADAAADLIDSPIADKSVDAAERAPGTETRYDDT